MGTWGPGNFDQDTAADHLSILTNRLITEVDDAIANPTDIEPDEYWGVAVPCNVELLCLINEQGYVGSITPELEKVQHWRSEFMAVWDAKIDGLNPKSNYKDLRRKVLNDTFDRLARLAEKEEA